MIFSISEALLFLRHNRINIIFARIRAREVPWLIQFGVYGFCGLMATVVYVGQVIILSKYVLPAFEGMTVDGKFISDDLRAKNLLINNCAAFVITNIFTYFTNVLLVFKQGRHHPWLEFLYFTIVNLICFAISQIAGPWIIHQFGVATSFAIGANTAVSVAINYVARKFFVFQT